MRNLDYYQDNEEISSAIYEVVSQLIGNEDPSNPLSINKEVAGNGEEKNEMNSVDSSRQVVEEVGEENNPLDEVD